MEIKLDLSKEYAIALEGGGAKGAYEIGVWQAFEEVGVKYCAVSGSSVGALNGALMAMRDLDKAVHLWENLTFSQIIDVDDTQMKAFFDKEMRWNEWPSFLLDMAKVIKNRGFDAEPLRNLLEEVVDEEKICQSDVKFYLVTYSLTDKKELDLEAATLPKGTLHDMLLASAYFPAFKQEPLSGKFYADGSIKNVVPLNSLVERGYKNIIVIRIFGVGYEKKVKIPEDVNVTVVAPREKLGGILQFDGEQTKKDMMLGYFDGMRLIYGLAGEKYYIDRHWSEEKAYAMLRAMLQWENANGKQLLNLREINEEILPKMAKRLHVKGGYYELCLRMLEEKAEGLGITPFVIRTEEELLREIAQMKEEK